MKWFERIISVHTAVTDAVSHAERLKSSRYFCWEEDGANDLEAGNEHIERAMQGTTELFTKTEFDPWAEEFEKALNADSGIAWELEDIQFEEETGFWHYTWSWEVPVSG